MELERAAMSASNPDSSSLEALDRPRTGLPHGSLFRSGLLKSRPGSLLGPEFGSGVGLFEAEFGSGVGLDPGLEGGADVVRGWAVR